MSDWLHINSIDYNPQLDQILVSVHNFNEIWVIDHSTTITEAASHSGGQYGHGGDLLYRWGNPESYRAGTLNDQKLFGQHDASWIKPGLPGGGDILVFNNGWNRPDVEYSSVDEIVPPVDDKEDYYLEPGSSFGPSNSIWSYTANPVTSFYASGISGAERLENSDTLICDGVAARFFEVNPEKETVWEYTNPYPTPSLNDVFKIAYIPHEEPIGPNLYCTGSLTWNNVKPGQTVIGSFQVQNIGVNNSLLNWTVNLSSIKWGTWTFTPEHGENLMPNDGQLTVNVTVIAPNIKGSKFEGYVQVENTDNPNDFEEIPIHLKTSLTVSNVRFPMISKMLYVLTHSTLFSWNIFDAK